MTYTELRFLISYANGDLVLGPNGCNLSRLNNEYDATVTLSDSSFIECVLTVGGCDLYVMCAAVEDVLQCLIENSESCELEIRWLVDCTRIESLTDHENVFIQQVVEETGCRIDVFPQNCPLSSERVVKMFGLPNTISQCVYQLSSLLVFYVYQLSPLLIFSPDDGFVIVCQSPYDPINSNPKICRTYGGFLPPPPPPPSQTSTNSKISPVAEEPAVLIKKYTIPSQISGAIIGVGGAHLQQVRLESGAKITLAEPSSIDPSSRNITIIGTEAQVENARLLLHLCIRYFCSRVS
jgi:heterogeneous nuclear rnp K-like protein 2